MVLSILRSWAFFFPALDFAFFPMIKSISELSPLAYYFRWFMLALIFLVCDLRCDMIVGDGGLINIVAHSLSVFLLCQLT